MYDLTKITIEVPDEKPASGYLDDFVMAIYHVVLDPQQRYRVRQFLREREEKRKHGSTRGDLKP